MNSLGFNKEPKDTRVVVAMSGGVDSSVAAALLKRDGYDVVGITLQLYDHGAAVQKKGACCAGADIYDAKCVASKIGIPHYVLDYESAFRESVMEDFADSYMKGETPIPCVRCNQRVKFRDLLESARDLGADCLATGHYAQRIPGANGPELHAGADPARDQSYFLFATTAAQLDYLRFPLGHLPKTETRRFADEFRLPVAVKPDSQDICFVPQGRYVDVVAKLRPGALTPGEIVHEDGRVLGRHDGIINFTIGQRKGLNLQQLSGSERDPLFVTSLDAPNARVIVGPRSALATQALDLKEMNWLAGEKDYADIRVKFRSAMEPIPAMLTPGEDGTARLTFTEAQPGIAPGQACVIYDGPRVLAGGWITRSIRAAAGAPMAAELSAAAE
jgi:tRNA-specific 2-thiouridylase